MAATRSSTEPKFAVDPHTRREGRVLVTAISLAALLLLADQFTKIWAERTLPGDPISVIPGFFSLTFVTNKGAAWGIFHGYSALLMLVAAVVTVLAIWFFRKLANGFIERYFALTVILSGVVGNAIDRLWRGEVVDFLDFNFWGYRFPTFNVADSAICCGVALYILSNLLRGPEKPAEKPADNVAD